MRIVEYTPKYFELLRTAVKMGSRNLGHREFVDYYYCAPNRCNLYLLFLENDQLGGMIGIERMTFLFRSQPMTVGFASNYYAFRPGAGGFLFLHWMKSCDIGISLGASEDAHSILRSHGWTYFDAIKILYLNLPYQVYPGDPSWKRAAKWAARQTMWRHASHFAFRIPAEARNRICVEEVAAYRDDLLPPRSLFDFRFAPSADYLAWRYNTNLPFVRYRPFRILVNGHAAGYVIFNDHPKRLMVAQCDAVDAEVLAYGVLRGMLEVEQGNPAPRPVMLSCSHPAMQAIYEDFGFRVHALHPLALGSHHKGMVPTGANTYNWLINYDWGDNGLVDLVRQPQSREEALTASAEAFVTAKAS